MRKLIALAVIAAVAMLTVPSSGTTVNAAPVLTVTIPAGGMAHVDTRQFPDGPVNYVLYDEVTGEEIERGTFTVANQVTTEPREKGPIEKDREFYQGAARADKRVETVKALYPAFDRFERGGLTFEVADAKSEGVDDQRLLRQEVRAWNARGELIFDDFHRVNKPPLLVPAATYKLRFVPGLGGETLERLVVDYTEDPVNALRAVIASAVSVVTDGGTNPHLPEHRGTVTTVYSTSADGYLGNTDSTSWANAQGAAGDTPDDVNTSASSYDFSNIAAEWTTGTWSIVEQALSFDTSSIPDTDNITDVALSVFANGQNNSNGGTIEVRGHNWGPTLTGADWIDYQTAANWTGLTLLASMADSAWSGSDGTENTYTSETAFNSYVNKTGVTYLGITNSRAYGADPAVEAIYHGAYYSEEAGTTNDPKLVITHEAGAGTPRRIIITVE